MVGLVCPRCEGLSYRTVPSGPHIKAICSDCEAFIKFIARDPADFIMPFGKYKGVPLSEIEPGYLEWASDAIEGNVGERIREYLGC